MRNGHLKTIRKLWKEWVSRLAEPFVGPKTFPIVPVECSLGEVPSWRKDSATPSRKSTRQACAYYLKCALVFSRFIQTLIVMGSISKAKSASFSLTPLPTK